MNFVWVLHFSILNTIFQLTSSITLVQLIINSTTTVLYNQSVYSQQFISSDTSFSCSTKNIFTYQQSGLNYENNLPYQLNIVGITDPVSINISVQFGNISPQLSQNSCSSSSCTIDIRNYCPTSVGYFNYFDRIFLNISGLQTFTYDILCNRSLRYSTFEAGQFVIIVFSVFIIILTAKYSRAWALQSIGIQITYPYIFVYVISLAAVGIILIVAPNIGQIIGDVAIWFLGIFGMVVSFNELIFKSRIQILSKVLINIKRFQVRILELISFILAISLLLGWILGNKNWILSLIISISLIIGTIKIFKITSFKKALILYCSSQTVQIIFIILINVLQKQSYEDFLINDFNNPLLIQMPTISQVFGLKCSWLPTSVTIFPGIFISYLRRFDNSRHTSIYLITSSISFFIGAIFWLLISVVSPFQFPFQIVSQPAMLGLIVIFAYNRKELKILWNGKFYDPQFMNQQEYEQQAYTFEMQMAKVQFKEQFMKGLVIDKDQDSQISQRNSFQVKNAQNQNQIREQFNQMNQLQNQKSIVIQDKQKTQIQIKKEGLKVNAYKIQPKDCI